MKIYADVFIFINAYIDYFLLLALKRIFHLRTKGIRMFLAAAFAGTVSLISLIDIHPLVFFILSFFSLVSICGIAFGFADLKRLLINTFFFYILSFAFAGLNHFLIEFSEINAAVIKGKVYYDINMFTLIMATALFYVIFTAGEIISRKKGEQKLFYKVRIRLDKKEISLICKLDTGNALKEPFSGESVIIVREKDTEKLFISKSIEALSSFRVIPYSSISGKGILKAFRPDEVYIDNKKAYAGCFVALHNEELGKNYSGLLPCELINT